jgi:hypothetical protein
MCFGTVRLALLRKISVQTAKREHINSGNSGFFEEKITKKGQNTEVRYAARLTKTDTRGKRYRHGTVRYGRRINSDSLLLQ